MRSLAGEMDSYSNQEKAEMHYMYGAAQGNAREAQRLYREHFPTRRVPDARIFQRLHQQLCERGSFARCMQDTGRSRRVRTPSVTDNIVDRISENPESSTRELSAAVNVSHSTVWRILREERMHPYHAQRVQGLEPSDYQARVNFSTWFLQQMAVDPDFCAHVLFTDECTFSREGIFNIHNYHVWSNDNPYTIRPRSFQQRFSVNIWAGIVHDYLIGPYLLPTRLDGDSYLVFLQEVLPGLLNDVPPPIRRRMWFQHDGAPAHFSVDVRNALNMMYPGRWIGRGGPVAWPPRSPDLSPLDFFLWGHMKSLIYDDGPVDSAEDLVARISVAAANIREMPGVFANVRRSLRRRFQALVRVGGRNFEQLL